MTTGVGDIIAQEWGNIHQNTWTPLPHQQQPQPPVQGKWFWFVMGGRGIGKTDVGAHTADKLARTRKTRGAIIAPTLGDARETCVRGDSGLLQANPNIRFNVSTGILTWPNGSQARIFGAFTPEDVERLRGPQHDWVWGDELAAWKQLDKPGDGDIWKHMDFGLRLGPAPFGLFTSTPKPKPRIRMLIKDPRCVVTTATTNDNPHLHQSVRDDLYNTYAGTRVGRQELLGELLEDVPGALWTVDMIEATRFTGKPADMVRLVVAVDPAGTVTGAETGLVVVGRGHDGFGYVLADRSGHYTPGEWADQALRLFDEFSCDRIVAERNQGGDMIMDVIHTRRPHAPVELVYASRGKRTRAEPVAALYEQGRARHVPGLELLEDQLMTWDASDPDAVSPDRLDALVWGWTALGFVDERVVGVGRDEVVYDEEIKL